MLGRIESDEVALPAVLVELLLIDIRRTMMVGNGKVTESSLPLCVSDD